MRTQSFSNLRATFVELNDLKRITSARRYGSIATRLFGDAWTALSADISSTDVAWWITGRAVAATRLGDIDRSCMMDAGLSSVEASGVLKSAIDEVARDFAIPERISAGAVADLQFDPAVRPVFVDALARQPRAGITCPGKPRILLEPPENHADHCLIVAVYGVLIAPLYAADPTCVFLAALAHHFHNAGMPDSGFAGEMLLGSHLDTMVAHSTRECLEELTPSLREEVEAARAILPTADSGDGRAFHAADVLDRVLQITQYARASTLTNEQMLGEMELVHRGPVKTFQDEVLRQAGFL